MHKKYKVESTCKMQDNKGCIVVFENTKENGYHPLREATSEELTEILNAFYDEPLEALKELRNRLITDKSTFETCNRDTLGHLRCIMLLDEMITEIKESNYARV